jgi:hypothetical protein
MDDPAKVLIAVSLFGSVAYSINAIARAAVAHKKEEKRLEREAGSPLAADRLARLEQAVDAIALEIERISEGQRFTTRLLSEQSRRLPDSERPKLSSNTPH